MIGVHRAGSDQQVGSRRGWNNLLIFVYSPYTAWKSTMNRASNFIGKPIFIQSGEQIDTIDDVIFDPYTHRVLCFIVEPGGWVGGAKILPWADDYTITPNALIISSQEQVVLARNVPRIQAILENTQVVIGKKIVAPDGRQIGILNDVQFDQKTGAIHEYEVTGSSPTTSSEQSVYLPPDDVRFELSRSAGLLVSAATAELIEKQIHTE
jgi:uncharacterized protein YrrD